MSNRRQAPEDHESPVDPTLIGTSVARLRRLSELDDYEVADGDPDIRGWQVQDADGEATGLVHDLVIDLPSREVRYLDVALDRRWLSIESDDPAEAGDRAHVLVPIGLARLHGDRRIVTLWPLTRTALTALPPYQHQPLMREDECLLIARLSGASSPVLDTDEEFYATAHFRTDILWPDPTDALAKRRYRVSGPLHRR